MPRQFEILAYASGLLRQFIAGNGRKTLHDKVAELHCEALCRGNNSLRHGNEGKAEEPESLALESLLKCAELLLGQGMFVVGNVFAIWQQSSENAVNLAESDRFLQHDETSRTEDSPHFFSCPWNLKMVDQRYAEDYIDRCVRELCLVGGSHRNLCFEPCLSQATFGHRNQVGGDVDPNYPLTTA